MWCMQYVIFLAIAVLPPPTRKENCNFMTNSKCRNIAPAGRFVGSFSIARSQPKTRNTATRDTTVENVVENFEVVLSMRGFW